MNAQKKKKKKRERERKKKEKKKKKRSKKKKKKKIKKGFSPIGKYNIHKIPGTNHGGCSNHPLED